MILLIKMRVLSLVLLCFRVVSAVKWCSKIDNCRCATDQGVINLWSLRSYGYRPRFNVSGKSTHNGTSYVSYIWSPCVPWTFNPNLYQAPIRNCTDVAVCCIEDFPDIGLLSTDIGEQQMMNCELTSNTSEPSCVLQYGVNDTSEHSPRIQTNIVLQCNLKYKAILDSFSALFDHKTFTSTLHSACACPGQCNYHGALPQRRSIGFLIIIVFVCCVVIYLIGGMIFNRIAKGARGKEMIPNLKFWMELPYLIKDGMKFSMLFCYSCFKAKKGYTAI